MMRAKDMIFDFLEMIFLIALISFFVYYFIVLNNIDIAVAMVRVVMPIGCFGVLLIFKVKQAKESIIKFSNDGNLDEVVFYVSSLDKLVDRIVILFACLVLYGLALFFSFIDFIDYIQIFILFFTMSIWHYNFFIRHDIGQSVVEITRLKQIKDEIVVYLIPVYILAPAVILKDMGTMDVFQSLTAFIIFFIWRQILYKK